MSEDLTRLVALGAQKIHEKTHISKAHVQSLLHNHFEAFTKIQFIGFISILEKEYKVSLEDLRKQGLEHFDSKNNLATQESIFVTSKKRRGNLKLYIVIFAAIIAAGFLLNALTQQEDNKTEIGTKSTVSQEKIDPIKVIRPKVSIVQKKKEVKKNLAPVIVKQDLNTSLEVKKEETPLVVATQEKKIIKEKVIVEKETVPSSFKIVTKSKVWFGYIDVQSNTKHQKSFQGELRLDPTKTRLLVFGHGYIDMYIDGKLQKFKSRDYKRFLYDDGKLEPISVKKFKRLNKGRKW